jgi:transcriptional regulator with XRE-family HTH domain
MYEYGNPRQILRSVREHAALTQRQLGQRAGVAQSVIARLEQSPAANPAVRTVAAVAAAAGFRLRVIIEPLEAPDPVIAAYARDVDRTLLRENLRLSAEERVRSLGEWQVTLAAMQAAARDARREQRTRNGGA